ncbi:MAG: COQ9 family protein [Alphaproteobacteria bacterium]|nr:COQ9 family protein [Alphaproteobacteria bacterium]
MNKNTLSLRDSIISAALEDAAFDGWRWENVLASGQKVEMEEDMIRAVFPGELTDVLDGLADLADREMLRALADIDPETLKVRERVKLAVTRRLEFLNPHKEAMREALAFWALPSHSLQAGQILWRTSDRIWEWAGDTATDYNRYTKRGLLSGILASTTLVWLNEDDPAMPRTLDFLARRIDNVVDVGRLLGKFGSRFLPVKSGKKAS